MARAAQHEIDTEDRRFQEAVRRFTTEIYGIVLHRVHALVHDVIAAPAGAGRRVGESGNTVTEKAPVPVAIPSAPVETTRRAARPAPKRPAAKRRAAKPPAAKPPAAPTTTVAAPPSGAEKKSSLPPDVLARKIAALRKGAAVRVACPAPGCKNPGVRPLSNFCVEHHKSIGEAQRKQLREAQKRAQAEANA